jgi:hypothetical protein
VESPAHFWATGEGLWHQYHESIDSHTGPDRVSATFKVPSPDFASEVSDAVGDWIAILPKRETMHNVEEEAAYDQNPIGQAL